MTAAKLENVTKRYGRQTALDDLSFSIPRGSVCGLVGPNGAGKTTVMGVMAGLLRPQEGQIDILGRGPFSVAVHAGRLGIMPQDSMPSAHAPIRDSLVFYAELQGMTRQGAQQEADAWLRRVRLQDKAKSKYGQLSNGMRRRFSVAQAMLGQPELILLDEPTSGLDPELVVEIRNLIVDLRGQSTVLVSSHILSELESMCDHAVFLENGRCVRQGPMRSITGNTRIVRLRLVNPPNPNDMRAEFPDCEVSLKGSWLTVQGPAEASPEALTRRTLEFLLAKGAGVLELSTGDTLESAYLKSKA